MASIHSCRDAVFAGFRNGFAGCPCLPYSRMLASLALLPPSERGSAKPTLMSWLPSRFSLEGERPSAPSSSPVVRDLNFVPLPITEERLLLTFFQHHLATGLQDGIRNAVKVAAELGNLQKEILRHFHVALSQRSVPPSLPAPQCTSHAPLHPPRTQCRSDSHRR